MPLTTETEPFSSATPGRLYVLGELYADIRIFEGLNITVGRQGLRTRLLSTATMFAMTPNTFEAIVLQGRTELGKDAAGQAKNSRRDPEPHGPAG